jgi:hypothetical protein
MKGPAKSTRPERHLRLVRAADLPAQLPEKAWLVRELWSHLAVGFIGGQPKSGKTWLALDLAVSVASGTHCLGRFPVDQPGLALAYFAEDSLPHVRERLASLCAHRRIPLGSLDLHLIDAPSLRLDDPDDQALLVQAVTRLKPRVLILDPLVRLHALDENSAADVSSLLGWLRALSRTHDLGIVLVHHMSKKSRRQLGQALRGSSDLHAWADSSAYLTRKQDKLLLTLEHRSSPARSPLGLQLALGPDGATPHLEPILESVASVASPPPIADRVVHALQEAKAPLSRVALRNKLRLNNLKLGDALASLERDGLVARTDSGWSLCTATAAVAAQPTTPSPPASPDRQLHLRLPTSTTNPP